MVYEQSGAEQGKAAILSPSFHFSETIINKLLTIFSFIIRNDTVLRLTLNTIISCENGTTNNSVENGMTNSCIHIYKTQSQFVVGEFHTFHWFQFLC